MLPNNNQILNADLESLKCRLYSHYLRVETHVNLTTTHKKKDKNLIVYIHISMYLQYNKFDLHLFKYQNYCNFQIKFICFKQQQKKKK